jgi:hypothetical protein
VVSKTTGQGSIPCAGAIPLRGLALDLLACGKADSDVGWCNSHVKAPEIL